MPPCYLLILERRTPTIKTKKRKVKKRETHKKFCLVLPLDEHEDDTEEEEEGKEEGDEERKRKREEGDEERKRKVKKREHERGFRRDTNTRNFVFLVCLFACCLLLLSLFLSFVVSLLLMYTKKARANP